VCSLGVHSVRWGRQTRMEHSACWLCPGSVCLPDRRGSLPQTPHRNVKVFVRAWWEYNSNYLGCLASRRREGVCGQGSLRRRGSEEQPTKRTRKGGR
jgi:hypothetical protein